MQSNPKTYLISESVERIDSILDSSDTRYEELDSIPARDRLTFTNGFYVYCTCLVIDIRKSSDLPSQYKRPTLAKIYRTFISECVAVINDNPGCREINIHGDSVWGVLNTPVKSDIDEAFNTAAKLSSVVDILNCRFKKKTENINPITVGIGIDYGRALMLKAGYKGSGINDVVWMGDVVNQANKLCSYASSTYSDKETMVSDVIHSNLKQENKDLLQYNAARVCYHGHVVNKAMDDWVSENC